MVEKKASGRKLSFLNEKRNTRPVRFICSMQVFAELQDIVYGVQAVKNKGWMPVGIPKKA